MRNPPLEVVASWPPPNYDNPVHRGPTLLIVEVTIMSVAILTLMARLYVRIFKVNKHGLDDWLMLAAMVFGIGVTVCVILAAQLYGWNIHVWDLKKSQAENGRKVSLAAQTLFLFSSGLAKNSILVSYLRIAPAKSWLRRLTYASLILVTSLIFIFLIVLWTQCNPTSAYWNVDGGDSCRPEGPYQAITTVSTDLLVCALPLQTLFHLKLPFSQRMALIVVFSLGLVVVFAASMRAYYTHYGFHLWIWTAVEATLESSGQCTSPSTPIPKQVSIQEQQLLQQDELSCLPTPAQLQVLSQSSPAPRRTPETGPIVYNETPRELGIQDDHIDIEGGYNDARRQKSSDSGASSLEMDTWATETTT
ncbi:hypothetical protein QL093DRAFT_2386484 [Fusarium oxysporum]|nr:hypothetical protein QL093DRAFT_2386484 [Fusarium oxysporum]